jgi:stage III sporulation protein AH
MDREQTRAANQAVLMEVINNTALTEEEKKSAIDGLAQMTDIAQREAACELLLESKGFEEAIVSLSSEGADVIINATELSDAQRAQIEDVIQRKGNVDPAEIVISTMDF